MFQVYSLRASKMNSIRCGNCGQELHQSDQAPCERPCPECGSIARTVIVNISATVAAKASIHAKLGWWERLPKKKALRWGVSGDDFHRKSGRWSVVVRTFDRMKDWYYEHITDKETGQVVRHTEERLSEHGRPKKK